MTSDPTLTEQLQEANARLQTDLKRTQAALTCFYDLWVQSLDPYNVSRLERAVMTEHYPAVLRARRAPGRGR